MSLKAMREKRAGLIKAMRDISDAAKKDDRDLTAEEQAQFDKNKADIEALDKRIDREAYLEEQEGDLNEPVPAASRNGGPVRSHAPEARRSFESLGEFLHAVRFNNNDSRLNYVETEDGGAGEKRADQRMGTGSAGGFMVPTQFRDTIMQVDPQEAIFRPRATVLPAGDPPDSAVSVPALDQSGSAPGNMYGGVSVKWTKEGGTVQETDADLREITLTPHEITGSIPITDKLLRNWHSAGPFLEQQLRGAVTSAEDFSFLSGSGVGKPLGILTAGATYAYNRAGANDIDYVDVVGMFAKLMGTNGVWVVSKSASKKLMQMEDSEGHLIWQPSAREGVPPTLLGLPVLFNQRNPLLGVKGDLGLYDISKYLIKDGSGPIVSMSEHVYFTTNKTLVKIVWNVDGRPWLTAPIQGENTDTMSPFVALDVPA